MSENNHGMIVRQIDGVDVEIVYTVHHYNVEQYGPHGYMTVNYRHNAPVSKCDDDKAERVRAFHILCKVDPSLALGYTFRKDRAKRGTGWHLIAGANADTAGDTVPYVSVTVYPIGGTAAKAQEDEATRQRQIAIHEMDRRVTEDARSAAAAVIEGHPDLRITACVVTVHGLEYGARVSHIDGKITVTLNSKSEDYWQVISGGII